MGIYVEVDSSEFLDAMRDEEEEITSFGYRVLSLTEAAVTAEIPLILRREFIRAVNSAGEGFFPQYVDHLWQGLQKLDVEVTADEYSVIVRYDDFENLGDKDELVQAYHYQAILADGEFSITNPPKLDLPYEGQTLYNEDDPETRQEFWEVVLKGGVYQLEFKGRKFEVDTAGDLAATLNARVEYWGDRYPEWILLDEGVSDGVPTYPPTHFISRIEDAIQRFVYETLEKFSNKRTYVEGTFFDRGEITRAIFDPRIGARGGLRGASGRFISPKSKQ